MSEMTTVPIAQTQDADNRSTSSVHGDASSDVTNEVKSSGGTYGPIDYQVDNSVAPVEVVLAPTISKGDSGQKAKQTATQSGDTPLMTAVKLLIPVIGMIAAYYLTKGKIPTSGGYYGSW